MNKALVSVAAVAAMLALGACASQGGKKMAAKPTFMTGPELAKAFKKGSITCNNVLADGTKVQDFYYKDKTAWSGNLDRNIGNKIKQGEWKILATGLRIKIGKKKKPYGKWYNLAKTGKKSFTAYDGAGKKYMTMKCK